MWTDKEMDKKMDELDVKGYENWNENDWETYLQIEEIKLKRKK